MKKTYSLIFLIFVSFQLNAQFSGNPAQPLEVCNAGGSQNSVTAFKNGNAGYFTFWLDDRNSPAGKEVYGQKLDNDGHILWAANGKSIVQVPSQSVTSYRCLRTSAGILFAWMQGQDSLFCKMIDNNGNDVWAQPTLVAYKGNGVIYVDASGFNLFETDSGIFITHTMLYTGGSSLFSFNRVSTTGVLHWPANNFLITLSGYDFMTQSDGQNGFYVLAKGNGMGSTFNIQRYNLQGIAQWASAVDITQGGNQNGLGGPINLHSDTTGSFYAVWSANNGKTLASKLNGDGTFAWNPVINVLDTTPNTQSRCHSLLYKNHLYAVWHDSRNASQVTAYMQKLDTSGTALYAANGIYVGDVNYYYGYPRLAFSDSNAVVCTFLGLGSIDLDAQRIRSNGSLSWPGNGVHLSTAGGAAWISYTDYVLLSDASGCNAVFWTTLSGDIWAAKICSDGNLVNLNEYQNTTTFSISPNPVINELYYSFSSDAVVSSLEVYNVEGGLIYREMRGNKSGSISTVNFPAGIYFLKMITDKGNSVQKFIKED